MRKRASCTRSRVNAVCCSGYTLLEILIAVVILGVIAGLALVSYTSYIRKAEKAEAIVNMDRVRKMEFLKHMETGTFLNAENTAAINALLGADIQERLFSYKVIDATTTDFMIIAERLGDSLMNSEAFRIAMSSGGILMEIGPSLGSFGGGGSGFGGGAGGGGGGGSVWDGGGSGSGGGDGGSSGGSSGGGSSGSGGNNSDDDGTSGGGGSGRSAERTITGFTTSTVCAYSAETLEYLDRCEDIFTDWVGGAADVEDDLLDAYNYLAGLPPFDSITEDINDKSLSVTFGDVSAFSSGGLCETAVACFAYGAPTPDPPAEPDVHPEIWFNPDYRGEDPRLLAIVLVHEGTHFQQYLDGDVFSPAVDLIDIEFRAFWNESALWADIRGDFGPPFTGLEAQNELWYQAAVTGEADLRALISQVYL